MPTGTLKWAKNENLLENEEHQTSPNSVEILKADFIPT